MTHACEAVKTRHKETSLIFPVLALVVLFLWGSSQSHYQWLLAHQHILALIVILSSAFSVWSVCRCISASTRRTLWIAYFKLQSVVILEVSLISALTAPAMLRQRLCVIRSTLL